MGGSPIYPGVGIIDRVTYGIVGYYIINQDPLSHWCCESDVQYRAVEQMRRLLRLQMCDRCGAQYLDLGAQYKIPTVPGARDTEN